MQYNRMYTISNSLIRLLRTEPVGATCFRYPEQHRAAHSENATEYAPLVCLDELGGSAAESPNDTVALHLVCPSCARIVHDVLEAFYPSCGYEHPPVGGHTMKSIRETAARGCHLCSLLIARKREAVDSECDDLLWAQDQLDFSCKYDMVLESRVDRKNFSSRVHFFDVSINRIGSFSCGQFHSRIPKILSPSHVAGLVGHWILTCASEHPKCFIKPCAKEHRPTRLIDISDPQSLVLVTKADLENAEEVEYITISYMWGKGEFFKLKSDNLALLKAGISYNLIPKTFQDVIHLARGLEARYIWIDALCILQDSAEDWAQESNRMADVYAYGLLNICVSNADANTGCSPTRNPLYWSHCVVANSGTQLVMAAHESYMPDVNEKDVLRRGWVFQERLLSPRTIYIGNEECMFECSSAISTERSPIWWEPTDRVSKRMFRKLMEAGTEAATAVRQFTQGQKPHPYEKDGLLRKLGEVWEKVVGAYIGTSLSFPSDRLPALAAIATALRDATGFDYAAGHWYELLPLGLLWHRSGFRGSVWLAPPRKRFPSWAWASAEISDHRCLSHAHPNYERWFKTECAKPLGWQVSLPQNRTAVLGEVEGARLRISGIVTRIAGWKLGVEEGKESFEMSFDNGKVLSTFEPDLLPVVEMVEFEKELDRGAALMLLTIYTHFGHEDKYGSRACLILAPYEDGFVRVGLVKLRLDFPGWKYGGLSEDEVKLCNPLRDVDVEEEVVIY